MTENQQPFYISLMRENGPFMLHVPLHITKVIDVGGVSLWVSSVCWDTNNHKPIMGYFGHGSGCLLN